MSDTIKAALIAATADIVAPIITWILSNNWKYALILFGYLAIVSSIVVLCLFYTKKVKELKDEQEQLLQENETLTLQNRNLEEIQHNYLNTENELSVLQEKHNDINKKYLLNESTLQELNKYFDLSSNTSIFIVRSILNEHTNLSKKVCINFEKIECNIEVIGTAEKRNVKYKWEYHCTKHDNTSDFVIDIFSTTGFLSDFEKNISIKHSKRNGKDWKNLVLGNDYSFDRVNEPQHRSIKLHINHLPKENIIFSVEYTLKDNYNITQKQEEFLFMPFIFENARNAEFTSKIYFEDIAHIQRASLIKSSDVEDIECLTDPSGKPYYEISHTYANENSFKNVSLYIVHK